MLSLTYYPVTYHDVMERPWRTERALVLPGVQQAADGLVGMACGTLQQRQDLYVMMNHAEWIEDDAIMSRPAEVAPLIAEWVAERTVDEIRELAIAFRIPNAPVADPSNVATLDHFEARRVFVENRTGSSCSRANLSRCRRSLGLHRNHLQLSVRIATGSVPCAHTATALVAPCRSPGCGCST